MFDVFAHARASNFDPIPFEHFCSILFKIVTPHLTLFCTKTSSNDLAFVNSSPGTRIRCSLYPPLKDQASNFGQLLARLSSRDSRSRDRIAMDFLTRLEFSTIIYPDRSVLSRSTNTRAMLC